MEGILTNPIGRADLVGRWKTLVGSWGWTFSEKVYDSLRSMILSGCIVDSDQRPSGYVDMQNIQVDQSQKRGDWPRVL